MLVLAAALAACGQKNDSPAAAAGGGAAGGGPPPAEVGVVTVQPVPVGLVTELPGRLKASRVAQVRARATGILLKRLFVEGSDVKPGQVLFKMTGGLPERRRRRAGDARARPGQRDAGDGAGRALQAAARGQRDQQAGLRQRGRGAEDRRGRRRRRPGDAAERPDQPRLRHRDGADPGRIGRALVTEGALVGQGDATPLAVSSRSTAYVNSRSPPPSVGLRRAARWQVQARGRRRRSVRMLLEDGSVYPQIGKLLFSDSASTRPPGRSRCAPRSRTRTASCCPACTCACASSRPRRRAASSCRSRASSAARPATR